MKKRSIKHFGGFTLIELLVVVLIIGILAAVAVPQYQKAVYKSRAAEAISMLKALQQAQEVYYIANGVYTDALEDLDVEVPADKVAPGWGQADINAPNKYMYSCNAYGSCIGNAANEHMPLLQYDFNYVNYLSEEEIPNTANLLSCVPWEKSDLAETICKNLGVLNFTWRVVNYYRVN